MIWNVSFPNWMNDKAKKEFMADIFGSEATRQRGLLDR